MPRRYRHKGLFGYGRFTIWDRKNNPEYYAPKVLGPLPQPVYEPPDEALRVVTPEMQVPQACWKKWSMAEAWEYVSKELVDRFRQRVLAGEDLVQIGGTENFPDFSILQKWVEIVPPIRDIWLQAERKRLFDGYKEGDVLPMADYSRLRPGERRMTKEIEEIVLAQVSEGRTLLAVCKDPNMPTAAQVSRWAITHPEFASRLEEARKLMAAAQADETIEIADSVTDGDDVEEDSETGKIKSRSKASDRIKLAALRIQVRRDMARWYDRDRFGDQVNVNQKITVDIGARMVAAQKRLESGLTIEGEGGEIGEDSQASSF